MADLCLLLVPFLLASFPGGSDSSATIGVNYGTLGNDLPSPQSVAQFLMKKTIIDRVKLFGTDPTLLNAFANTGILVTVTVANGEIVELARLTSAQKWVTDHIIPFLPATKIIRIAVGNEVLATSDKNLIAHTLPAMKALLSALQLAGISDIQVSTPHSLGILSSSEPPSSGSFRRGYDRAIFAPMLNYHRKTKSPFMINPYPYFAGVSDKTLNYALFLPNPGVWDPVTKKNYTNMFDAQLDAVYSAMKRLGFGDVDIVVAETGWPSVGDSNQALVSLQNALSYNSNLVRHVTSGKGTPLMPSRRFETYIFALFNENQKPGSTAERNFGLFRSDFSPVYDAGVLRLQGNQSAVPMQPHNTSQWCVAKEGMDANALEANINWVCGLGSIDCRPIIQGGPCFQPDEIESHASYIMNAYYQKEGHYDYNCDFRQTGEISTTDPSHGNCTYLLA